MVFYRKYRPQTISQLDLSSVRDKLTNILTSKELPHAFLFTGPKGLGKTSSARILAKAINCENKNHEARIKNHGVEGDKKKEIHNSKFMIHTSDFEPCNTCEACVTITDGSNIDVLEIDAASNGGVEEMRTLRERVKFASSALKYKVYIIDEVHMLSTGAFNALLKTLEEPPSHVVFILATTELAKLPETVVSRTFQVQFEKPTKDELLHSLERIIKGEGLKVDKNALDEVYSLADGSFRDAAKILEELSLSAKGSEITAELVGKIYKTAGIDGQVTDLLQYFAQKDAKKALLLLNNLLENGADFKILTERLASHLRGLLMTKNGIESSEPDIVGLSIIDVKTLLELTNEAYSELKISVIQSLPLELLTVKFCIIDNENKGQKMQIIENLNPEQKTKEASSEEIVKKTEKREEAKNILKPLIDELNTTNKPGAALLRSCKEAVLDGKKLIITTPFPIHAERLSSDNVLGDLKNAAEKVLGGKIEVVIKYL